MDKFITLRIADDGSDDQQINPAHVVRIEGVGEKHSRVWLVTGQSLVGKIIQPGE